jgi:hypothetical protein
MSRAFSIAMTAWAAKFCSNAICLSVKGRTFLTIECDRAKENVVSVQRHYNCASNAADFDEVPQTCGGRKASVILSISDLKDALARFDSPQGSSSTGWSGAKLPQPIAKLRVSVDCTKMKTLTVPRPQKTKGRFA